MTGREPEIDVEELWLAAGNIRNSIARLMRRIKEHHERLGWSKGKAEGILGLLERARMEMGPVEIWLSREVGKFWERSGKEEEE